MPEDVAKVARSYTGQYLKPLLKGTAPGRIAPSSRKMKAAE
jgi:excinuclease ABC subunit A